MKNKLSEWLSIQRAKNPGKFVLFVILLFNVCFFLLAALVISSFSLEGTEKMGFLEAAFCTVTMILDAGCVQFVIADIGQANVAVAVFCLLVIFIGMVSFTGAVIGYITNYISSFIENSNSSTKKLRISNHIVILNWNTRTSEIINDLLYCKTRQKVVVLVTSGKADIERELRERLEDTVQKENEKLWEQCKELHGAKKYLSYFKNRFKGKVTVIVREGDVFSFKQLRDISLERARSVMIMGSDINNTVCRYAHAENMDELEKGNSQTVKTLMQVADITGAEYSDDDQKIIVEITDDWTWELVGKIIRSKQVDGKCNIVPVRINRVLGQLLSQFSLMPELNLAYQELFSNRGATFYAVESKLQKDEEYIPTYLSSNKHAIPLTFMKYGKGAYCYYSASSEKDISRTDTVSSSDYSVKLNGDYWIEQKNVIILGHNSKSRDIMGGFNSFRSEWNYKDSEREILRIMVIDDEKSLEKMGFYKEYPYVVKTVAAEIYDRETICASIEEFVASSQEDTSILILSDDKALNENIDSGALANLIYVQDIIRDKKENDPDFDEGSIDVVVEIIDPKHHDVVCSYSVNNVVISNRYISKMITQIGEKEALYDFYTDILTYDDEDTDGYESKEVYIKKVDRLFKEIPAPCTAQELIRAVYAAASSEELPEKQRNPMLVLGVVHPGGEMVLFDGDQSRIKVSLGEKDKLVVFGNH